MLITRENWKRDQHIAAGTVGDANSRSYRAYDVLGVYPAEKTRSGCAPHLAFVRVSGVDDLYRFVMPWRRAETASEVSTVRRRAWHFDVDRLPGTLQRQLASDQDIAIDSRTLAGCMFHKRLGKYLADMTMRELADADGHDAKVDADAEALSRG